MVDSGNLPQKVGISAIDESVLPNVLTPSQAKILLAGGHVKIVLIKMLAKRQMKLLTAIGKHVCVYVFTYIFIHIYIFTYLHIYSYIFTYLHIYIFIYLHIHTYLHIHSHLHIHTYSYIFIHIL